MIKEAVKWKEHVLVDGQKIYFNWYDNDYGVAEFSICPVYKYGKLKELYVYPLQQRDVDTYYKAVFSYSPIDISIGSWVGLEEPRIWLHYWCKTHRCASFRLYVPKESRYFQVEFLSGFSLNFGSSE